MSSDSPQPLPRTAVPLGITDPVEKARAELKAALAAIEIKGNVPRRLSHKIEDGADALRELQRRNPAVLWAGVALSAAAIGGVVWGFVRAYTR